MSITLRRMQGIVAISIKMNGSTAIRFTNRLERYILAAAAVPRFEKVRFRSAYVSSLTPQRSRIS
jgi:hypothetical protein